MSATVGLSELEVVSTGSTLRPGEDPRHLYTGVVADINFRLPTGGTPVIIKEKTVHEIIDSTGPSAIMDDGSTRPQVRWIHLPANCMAWVEVYHTWNRPFAL